MAEPLDVAYVEIRPRVNLSEFQAEVRKSISNAFSSVDQVVSRSLGGVDNAVKRSFAPVSATVERVGKETGQSFGEGVSDGLFPGVSNAFDRVEREARSSAKETVSVFGRLGGVMKGALAAGAGIGAISGLKSLASAAAEAASVGRITEQVIKSTGGAAQRTTEQVSDLAGSLSEMTGVDDEVIQSAQNVILTFKNIKGDQFDATTKAALDLSTVMGGDVKGAALQLSKALNDPAKGIAALTRSGVTFTDAQKEQIAALLATGDAADRVAAQQLILNEVNSQVGGAAAAAANPMDRLNVIFGNIAEQVGAAVLPMFEKLADLLSSPAFQNAAAAIGGALTSAFKVVGDALSFVVAQVQGVADAFGGMGSLWSQIAPIASALGAGLTAAAGAIAVIVGAMKAWAAVQGIINALLVANPIGITVVAIGALVAGLTLAYQKSAAFRDGIDGIITTVKNLVSAVAPSVQELAGAFSGVVSGFDGDAVAGMFGRIATGVQQFIAQIAPIVQSGLIAWFQTAAAIVRDSLVPAFHQLVAFVTGTLAPAVGDIARTVAKNVIPVFDALVDVIARDVLPVIQDLWSKFSKDILPVLLKVARIVIAVVKPFIKLAVTIMGKVLPPLIRFAGPILGAVIKIISTVVVWVFKFINLLIQLGQHVGSVGGAIGKAFEKIGAVIGGVIGAIGKGIAAIPGMFGKVLSAVTRFVTGMGAKFQALTTTVVGAVSGMVTRVVGFFVALPGRAFAALKSLGGQLKSAFTSAFNTVSGFVSTKVAGIVSAFTSLPDKIRNVGGKLKDAGKNIIDKLFEGVKDAVRSVGGFAKDIGRAIKDAVNDFMNLPKRISIGGSHGIPEVGFTIPAFAKGGVVDRATLGVFGEAGREALVPLSKRSSSHAARVLHQSGVFDRADILTRVDARRRAEGKPLIGDTLRVGGMSKLPVFTSAPLPTVGKQPASLVASTATPRPQKVSSTVVNASFQLPPTSDPGQHAQQIARRLNALMDR